MNGPPEDVGPVAWTRRDRRALASVAVQFFVNGAVIASYVPRLPGVRDRLGVDLSTIGWIIGLSTLGVSSGRRSSIGQSSDSAPKG